jgi:hypothetical protein
MHYPGSRQVGLAKRCLAGLPFHRFETHPEWVEAPIRWGAELYAPPFRVYCAGIPGEVRVAFIPGRYYHWDGPVFRALEPGVPYDAWRLDPIHGGRTKLGPVRPAPDGSWQAPTLPLLQDWVFILLRRRP